MAISIPARDAMLRAFRDYVFSHSSYCFHARFFIKFLLSASYWIEKLILLPICLPVWLAGAQYALCSSFLSCLLLFFRPIWTHDNLGANFQYFRDGKKRSSWRIDMDGALFSLQQYASKLIFQILFYHSPNSEVCAATIYCSILRKTMATTIAANNNPHSLCLLTRFFFRHHRKILHLDSFWVLKHEKSPGGKKFVIYRGCRRRQRRALYVCFSADTNNISAMWPECHRHIAYNNFFRGFGICSSAREDRQTAR